MCFLVWYSVINHRSLHHNMNLFYSICTFLTSQSDGSHAPTPSFPLPRRHAIFFYFALWGFPSYLGVMLLFENNQQAV